MKAEYDFSKGMRGAVFPVRAGATRVSIVLDDDLLDWFRDRVEGTDGGDYQLLINAALREHVSRQRSQHEPSLR